MHLVEQYALGCGVKINKPFIHESFFPLKEDKYISFHSHAKFQSRNYSYFSEVIEIIKSRLDEEGIKIIHLGIHEDPPVKNCDRDLRGKCNINQSAYIIKNSLLHFGVDSFLIHLSSYYDTALVGLYSNMYPQQSGPYWGSKDNQALIESPKGGNRPSYAAQENPKTINLIKPEEISSAILNLLNLNDNLGTYKTLSIGKYYNQDSIEIVPNFYNPSLFPDKKTPLNIRCDYEKSNEHLKSWIKSSKCHLIINKEEPIEDLLKFKGGITRISILLNNSIREKYVDSLVGTGLPIDLVYLGDKDLKDYQIKFLDYNVIHDKILKKKDLDSHKEICDNTSFKSSKTIFSNDKMYSSNAHRIKGIEKSDSEKIIDNQVFWKDQAYYMIYNS